MHLFIMQVIIEVQHGLDVASQGTKDEVSPPAKKLSNTGNILNSTYVIYINQAQFGYGKDCTQAVCLQILALPFIV